MPVSLVVTRRSVLSTGRNCVQRSDREFLGNEGDVFTPPNSNQVCFVPPYTLLFGSLHGRGQRPAPRSPHRRTRSLPDHRARSQRVCAIGSRPAGRDGKTRHSGQSSSHARNLGRTEASRRGGLCAGRTGADSALTPVPASAKSHSEPALSLSAHSRRRRHHAGENASRDRRRPGRDLAH